MDTRNKEKLADYIRRIRAEKDLSTSDVERKSGFTVTDGYVSHIENGRVKNVSPEKLSALAKGLGVPEDEVFAVARGKSVSGDLPLQEVRLLDFFRSLPQDKKDDLIAYAEMMKKRHGSGRLPEPRGIQIITNKVAVTEPTRKKKRA